MTENSVFNIICADMSDHTTMKGRGTAQNPAVRYLGSETSIVDDGWCTIEQLIEETSLSPSTVLNPDKSRSLITSNKSPDIPFDQSINPYRGCEHGCVYCYARPTHAYLDLSPGLDFETKIFYKTNVVELLRQELGKPSYRCRPIAIGTNTDPYQPAEKQHQVTRQILEFLLAHKHPVSIVTKGNLILRDLDLLNKLAALDLVSVAISVTTLQTELKTRLEPRAASHQARLRVVERLTESKIRTGVMVAPIIPMLNDHEIEQIVSQSARAGAQFASYVMVRLPLEVESLFQEWLHAHYPHKADRVMNRIRDLHGGRTSSSEFGIRMRGSGSYAKMIRSRFETATRKYGLDQPRAENLVNAERANRLRTDLFEPPGREKAFF